MNKIIFLLLTALLAGQVSRGQTTTEIAKTGIKSTVSVVSLDKISQPLGYGSGFIIDDEIIATNVHVIIGSHSAYVLLNGQEKKLRVDGYVAIDKRNDLILLKVSGLYGKELPLGSEAIPDIGEKIYAVGNPKGLSGTFSEGIISGVRDLTTNEVLQITAPISPGSSGGPVLNSNGQVVGIAFASFTSGQNLNFAIPVKYLITLKSKVEAVTPLSIIKSQSKATAPTVNPNIKEGVTIRNIVYNDSWGLGQVEFSIKNNLSYSINSIKILFLAYDVTGTVVDYYEYPNSNRYSVEEVGTIKPFLAKSSRTYYAFSGQTTKIKARVLNFKIIEE